MIVLPDESPFHVNGTGAAVFARVRLSAGSYTLTATVSSPRGPGFRIRLYDEETEEVLIDVTNATTVGFIELPLPPLVLDAPIEGRFEMSGLTPSVGQAPTLATWSTLEVVNTSTQSTSLTPVERDGVYSLEWLGQAFASAFRVPIEEGRAFGDRAAQVGLLDLDRGFTLGGEVRVNVVQRDPRRALGNPLVPQLPGGSLDRPGDLAFWTRAPRNPGTPYLFIATVVRGSLVWKPVLEYPS